MFHLQQKIESGEWLNFSTISGAGNNGLILQNQGAGNIKIALSDTEPTEAFGLLLAPLQVCEISPVNNLDIWVRSSSMERFIAVYANHDTGGIIVK